MSLTTRRRLLPADRREELLQAGEQVIRAKGVAATVDDVVRAAGAARGTFYVYFPTWAGFIAALRTRVLGQLEAQIGAFDGECRDWRTVARRLPELFIKLSLGLEGLHEAVLHARRPDEALADRPADIDERLRALLEEGRRAGALQATDVEATAWFVHAVCFEAAERALGGADPERIAEVFGEALVRALQAAPIERRPPKPPA
jgi:AcrR family transcriptional regulator